MVTWNDPANAIDDLLSFTRQESSQLTNILWNDPLRAIGGGLGGLIDSFGHGAGAGIDAVAKPLLTPAVLVLAFVFLTEAKL